MPGHADQEREHRSSVFLRALIHAPDGGVEFRVRNLSEHGMCVDHDGRLSVGQWLPLTIGGRTIDGMVVWATESLAGFSFDNTLNLEQTRNADPKIERATSSIKSGWLSDRPDPYRLSRR